MMITALIIHAILTILGIDPQTPFTVTGITWYYGSYTESVGNYTHVYTGVNVNSTLVISVNDELSIPINVSYTLSIGSYSIQGLWELQPGNNSFNITVPALPENNYNANLIISTVSYTIKYYFTVSSVVPGITINTTTTRLYSGMPQVVTFEIMNSTPIPISSALITVTGVNAAVGNGVITVKPPQQT